MNSAPLSLVYSVADQNFAHTKSQGILNLSLQLGEALGSRSEIERFDVFSNSSLREWNDRLAGRSIRCFDRAGGTRAGRILWDQWHVYRRAVEHRGHWLFLPKGFASFCQTPRIKVAAYVHDVIGEWYRQRYPNAASPPEAWYFRHSLLATVRHASVIFTNSHFTRSEVLARSTPFGRLTSSLRELAFVRRRRCSIRSGIG